MIIHKPVGRGPIALEVKPDLAILQRLVGGYIEAVWLTIPTQDPQGGRARPIRILAYVNEEGLIRDLPQNFPAQEYTESILVDGHLRGDVVFCGGLTPSGATRGLNGQQTAAILRLFAEVPA